MRDMKFLKTHTEVLSYSLMFFIVAVTGCPGDHFMIYYRHEVNSTVSYSAVTYAKSRAGSTFFLGCKGPDFFDCTGLITWAYRKVDSSIVFKTQDGFSTTPTVNELYYLNILSVDRYHVRRGDIAFITSISDKSHGQNLVITHSGLFIEWINPDKFRFIDASSYYGKVVIDSFSVSDTIRGQWFVGFGRLLR